MDSKKFVIYVGRSMAEDERKLLEKSGAGVKQPKNALYLDSFEELYKVLSPKKIDLLKYLAGEKRNGSRKSVNEIAKNLGRKQEAISRDLHYLKGLDLIALKKERQAVYVFTGFNGIRIET